MTNAYTFRVGGDFNELIRGFQQLETQAQKAGNKVGQNLNDGIQGFSSRSLAALNQELNRLQQRQTKVAVDSTAFEKAGAKIRDIQALIAQVEKKRLLIGVDDKSITALQAKLQALQSKQTKIRVDSKEFEQLQREIGDTEKELQQINNRKLLINADPSSITALQAKLQALQSELNRVQVGSQRFKELKTAIQATEDQLARAGEAVGDFRILDGVIQGVAFSLSNLVVDGAGRALSALQGLVAEYGRLDTEIRQAAAASGEAGAYDRLARTIDQVGIEAAGTTQDVARLTTELSRGGMTVEQVAATMPGIVRGAEATGTAFDRMGSIVSASLKIFQLEVSSTARVVDALVTGANASATDVNGLGYALKYAGPPAKLLGISIEELTAAIGLLTNAGIEASEAGVTLRNGLSKLASSAPTASGGVGKLTGQAKMASDTMKQLGINIFEADGTLKPMQETLLTLKAAFDQLEPASRIRLAANLFGGEDDGTKWLALLGQTEGEIIKLTDTMSNTAGATDKARDAMQGFELKGKQLQGTLGSIGNVFGRVVAAGLIPFLDIANNAAGLIAGLPDPVKNTSAALIVLTGAFVAGRVATLLYGEAIKNIQVQAAITGISSLGNAIKRDFVGNIAAAVVSWNVFITTVRTEGIVAGLANLTAGLRASLAAAAPLAIKLGLVYLAFDALSQIINASSTVSEGFADRTTKVQAAIDKLNPKLKEQSQLSKDAQQSSNGLIRFFEKLPIVIRVATAPLEGFLRLWDSMVTNFARANQLDTISSQFEQLQNQFTQVQSSAIKTLASLKGVTNLSPEQKKGIQEQIAALKVVEQQAKAQAEAYRQIAAEARVANNEELAKQAEMRAIAMEAETRATAKLVEGMSKLPGVSREAAKGNKERVLSEEELKRVLEDRKKIEQELNQLVREAPVRNLEAQLTVGRQLVGLSQALIEREQSRFAIVKSGLEFELQKAQERGASETQIAAIKRQIDAVDRQAMEARYQGLLKQQQLEITMFQLTQQKQRLEANFAIQEQQIKLKEAQVNLSKAASEEEKKLALATVDLENQKLTIRQQQLGILSQTQPIEAAILSVQQETARNTEQARAAQMGYKIAADGTLTAVNSIANLTSKVGVVTSKNAYEQDRIARIAAETGISIKRAADGSMVLGKNQSDVVNATSQLNRLLSGTATTASKTASAAGNIGDELNTATKINAFETTSGRAPVAIQGARDFAGWLSNAQSSVSGIARLPLDNQMNRVATATQRAANSARAFYDWLQRASRLPQGRFAGGDVEAGQTYRINEIGQESLLANGRLSLITAPPNSLWRAPSDGVVVPANITSKIKESGGTNADLIAEIGNLRQAIARLSVKDWNINIQQKTGPTASHVMNKTLKLM